MMMVVESTAKGSSNSDEFENEEKKAVVSDPFAHPLVLPTLPTTQWPHDSILLQAASNTHVVLNPTVAATAELQKALPIGVPIDFETTLFRGQFLVRLRNNISDDPKSHEEYFRDRKRVLQTVVQGQFKKNINMSDLYIGSVFRQPMKYPPPIFFMRILRGLFSRIAPGAILDFNSNQPRMISLYAGAAKAVRIDIPGQEPDIRSIHLSESIVNLVKEQDELLSGKGGKKSRAMTDPKNWS